MSRYTIMRRVSFIFAVLLVCSCQIGSRAQTPVFVKTGEDLLLEVKEADVPEGFLLLTWRFKGWIAFVSFLLGGETEVSDLYTGRVEVSVKHFSVKLKNLQKSDSGVYTALVISPDKDLQLSRYLVTVEDPVSPVKLEVNSNSKDSCDLTVTCRSLDSHQISISISTTVTCNTTTCSQEGGERSKVTTSGATLDVYLVDDQIICNHSNRVSRTNETMKIRDFCPQKPVVINAAVIIRSSVSAAVIFLGLILGSVFYMKCRRMDSENTVYAVPQESQSAGEGCTTYALVQFHTGPDESTKTVPDKPETIYPEVNKGRKLKTKPPRTNTEELSYADKR